MNISEARDRLPVVLAELRTCPRPSNFYPTLCADFMDALEAFRFRCELCDREFLSELAARCESEGVLQLEVLCLNGLCEYIARRHS